MNWDENFKQIAYVDGYIGPWRSNESYPPKTLFYYLTKNSISSIKVNSKDVAVIKTDLDYHNAVNLVNYRINRNIEYIQTNTEKINICSNLLKNLRRVKVIKSKYTVDHYIFTLSIKADQLRQRAFKYYRPNISSKFSHLFDKFDESNIAKFDELFDKFDIINETVKRLKHSGSKIGEILGEVGYTEYSDKKIYTSKDKSIVVSYLVFKINFLKKQINEYEKYNKTTHDVLLNIQEVVAADKITLMHSN